MDSVNVQRMGSHQSCRNDCRCLRGAPGEPGSADQQGCSPSRACAEPVASMALFPVTLHVKTPDRELPWRSFVSRKGKIYSCGKYIVRGGFLCSNLYNNLPV